ncbi:MAG: hypothetical protein IPO87_04630 [Flavobacteriales bacterium]|nr:hypothetical protein [Flavobacteriales bacterium]
MAGIVRGYDCGVVIPVPTPEAIAQAVRELQADKARQVALRANATFAAREHDGAREQDRLRDVLAP